ncbi:uncharacterized protein LOC109795825 [Cajanus cajan]|uniref:uncharacterized protein LOC109795825 n=1 Tax=Cajanus cajan TaxID=3821 RepID=UPI00098DC54B|nr:uncharacterized protein LOC109795825 [Cajanus cajan]
MAFSRRPARFKRPDFMQTEPISQEKLEMLRAAAARVYINEKIPAKESLVSVSVQQVDTIDTVNANVEKKQDHDNGVQLLATVASEFHSLEWCGKKKRSSLSGRKQTR